MDQPGKVANPALGQLNRENEFFKVMFCRVSTEPYPEYLPGFYPYPELL